MGDQPTNIRYTQSEPEGPVPLVKQPADTPFHAQLEDLTHMRAAPQQTSTACDAKPFDLRHIANALPQYNDQHFDSRRPPVSYGPPRSPSIPNPASLQYMQQMPQFPQRHDPMALAKAQQQPFVPHQYGMQHSQYSPTQRQQPAQLQTQQPFGRMDPYGYRIQHPGYSPIDMRFPQPGFPASFGIPGAYAGMTQYARRSSEPMAVPSFPRGPPRKPKQSGHALWVGNLPPAANVGDLKDHFSRDATKDIESLFLISKSNCAFVNYRTEAACVAAMNRFHDSRFHGVRLVCRLRRGSSSSSTTGASALSGVPDGPALDGITSQESADPTIAGMPTQADSASRTDSPNTKVPEKFFIVKSLTLQDLEASVRNGIWATQSHNEKALDTAFAEAENVYLIFSANKSGEYFGYARMGSSISGEPVPIGSAPTPQSPAVSEGPQSIPTPATETAPRGRIIDDSARGTIFWEAEQSDDEGSASPEKESVESGSQDLGRPFNIEWLSTARLPFYRTRGLRNPWNANREVKIARDGTELEPSVGKRLVQMFHRPAQIAAPPMMAPGGVPYHLG